MIRRSGDSRRTFSLINSISVYSDSGGIVQLECVSDQVLGLCVFIHLLHWTLFYHDKYIPTSPNCFSIAFDSTTTNMITQFFFLLYLSFMISVSTDKMYTQKVSPSFSHIHLSRCDADEEKKIKNKQYKWAHSHMNCLWNSILYFSKWNSNKSFNQDRRSKMCKHCLQLEQQLLEFI